jgi:NAD(P)-dependent dehydrogenase (short-subunit alcohol dehydrogenase family)
MPVRRVLITGASKGIGRAVADRVARPAMWRSVWLGRRRPGDAFHSPAQISHPEWSAVADHDVAQTFAARRTLLTELARPNTIGFAYHFGDQPFGRVITDGTGATTWAPIPAIAVAPPPRA